VCSTARWTRRRLLEGPQWGRMWAPGCRTEILALNTLCGAAGPGPREPIPASSPSVRAKAREALEEMSACCHVVRKGHLP
jgi:hypothetical protein